MKNVSFADDTYHNRYAPDRKHNKGNKKFKPLKKVCARCGTTKGTLEIHHKDGNRNNNARSNLEYLCRSCHRKLHAKLNGGKGSLNSVQIYTSASRIIENPNSPESEAIAKQHQNSDLMHVEFILCHADKNSNLDEFTADDLRNAAPTAINKPVNWEHSNNNIGVIYASKFVDVKNLTDAEKEYYKEIDPLKKDFVVCQAAIWEYKNPIEAKKMRDRQKNGNLFFSMENQFGAASCSVCHETFNSVFEYCDHLLTRRQTGIASRIFIDSNFVGAGVTQGPADVYAKSIALASLVEDDKIMNSLMNTNFIKSMNLKKTLFSNLLTAQANITISKKANIPDEYNNNLSELPDEAFADAINRIFPIDSIENLFSSAEKIFNSDCEFYNNEEKIFLVKKIIESAKAFNIDINEFLYEDDKGGTEDMTIDKNSAEFKEAVAAELNDRLKEIENGSKLAQLEQEITDNSEIIEGLKLSMAEKEKEKDAIAKELEEYKKNIELQKTAEARYETLIEKGFEFKDNLDFVKESIARLNNDSFDQFLSILNEVSENAKASVETNKDESKGTKKEDPVEESNKTAIASKVDNENEKNESGIDLGLKQILDL